KVARDESDQVAQQPGQKCRRHEQADGPGKRSKDHLRDRAWVGRERWTKVEAQKYTLEITQILGEEIALEAVEFLEGFTQLLERLGSERLSRLTLHLRDIAINRITRHEPRKEERNRYSNEQNHEVDHEPFGKVLKKTHMTPHH